MKKNDESNWMVLYTKSRWEKKVNQLLTDSNITSYCPLVKTSKKWADRSKIVEIPLFSSYLFVYAPYSAMGKILQTSGVITYVTFCGKPAIVTNNEINAIKDAVSKYTDIQPVPLSSIKKGDCAAITDGPFNDRSGEIKEVTDKSVIMVIESMNCALTIKINRKKISPINDISVN